MRIIRLFTSFTLASIIVSCTGIKQVSKIEKPITADCKSEYGCLDNENINLKFHYEIPQQYRNLNTGIEFSPILYGKDSTKRYILERYIVEGKFHSTFCSRQKTYATDYYDGIEHRSIYNANGTTIVSYSDTIKYENWMQQGKVQVNVYANSYHKRKFLMSIDIPTSFSDLTEYIDNTFKEKYYYTSSKIKSLPATGGKGNSNNLCGTFKFDSDKIEFKSLEKQIKEYLDKVKSSFEFEDYRISVTISNSPEGSVKHNEYLGKKRMEAIYRILEKSGVNLDKCSFSVITENWDDIKVATSNGNYRHSGEILSALNEFSDLDKLEEFIRDSCYEDWCNLKKTVYPQLRYCSINIIPIIKGKEGSIRVHHDEKQTDRIGRNIFSFTPGTSITQEAINDSLNCLMLDKVKKQDFRSAAEIADMITNEKLSQIIMSNKGMVYLKIKDFEKASAIFKKCHDIPEARYNLGILLLKERNYKEAEPLLEEFDNINKAIVKIALGKKKEASDIIILIQDTEKKKELTNLLKKH